MFNFTGVIKEESFLSTSTPGLHKITETVISSLRLAPKSPTRKSIVLAGDLLANSMDDVRIFKRCFFLCLSLEIFRSNQI